MQLLFAGRGRRDKLNGHVHGRTPEAVKGRVHATSVRAHSFPISEVWSKCVYAFFAMCLSTLSKQTICLPHIVALVSARQI
jgi:hypothetical protein